MKTIKRVEITYEYVEFMLDDKDIKPNVIYISKKYGISIHWCLCGCGLKTVLPLTDKSGWKLIEKNDKISFTPSILNPLPCESHYIITKNIANFV